MAIRVRGVGRVEDEPRAVLVCLTDVPSDHWIRNFHDAISDWHPLAPPLPAEPEDGNKTERAFEKWWNDPLVMAMRMKMREAERALLAMAKASFMEGARYATDRCDASGHHHTTQ